MCKCTWQSNAVVHWSKKVYVVDDCNIRIFRYNKWQSWPFRLTLLREAVWNVILSRLLLKEGTKANNFWSNHNAANKNLDSCMHQKKRYCKNLKLFSARTLNLFKHVSKLINKQSVRDPSTVQLLLCNNCCTCTEQK